MSLVLRLSYCLFYLKNCNKLVLFVWEHCIHCLEWLQTMSSMKIHRFWGLPVIGSRFRSIAANCLSPVWLHSKLFLKIRMSKIRSSNFRYKLLGSNWHISKNWWVCCARNVSNSLIYVICFLFFFFPQISNNIFVSIFRAYFDLNFFSVTLDITKFRPIHKVIIGKLNRLWILSQK